MSDDSDRGRTSVHGAGGAMAKRLLGILGRSLAIAAALILIGVTMFQDRLLYFPEPATVAEMLSPGLIAWPMAEDFRGLLAEPVGFIRGTAIVFHGNAGHAGHLRAFGRPVMVALAARDSIVPARFGGALYDALSVPRRLALIPGAEHNDWADRVDAGWWLQAIDFLLGKEK